MAHPKFDSLESLRGFAAVSVVLFHFGSGSSVENSFIQNAWLMVDFFFVLSGFVMTLAYADRLASRGEFVKFAKKRFLRIYPLHILVLLAFVAIESLKLFAVNNLEYAAVVDPFSDDRSLEALAANVMLIHNLVLPYVSWNHPSWSISAEFFVYLVFAAVYLGFRGRAKVRAGVFLLLLILAWVVIQFEGMAGQWNISGPSRCIYSFVLGHFAYLLLQRNTLRNLRFLGGLMLGLSIIAVAMEHHLPEWSVPFIPVLFASTIYCIVRSPADSTFVRVLEMKPLVFLGTISYGIYMWHVLVIILINIFVRQVLSYPMVVSADGRHAVEYPSAVAADVAIVLLMASSIGLAWISHRFYETRFYRSTPRDAGPIPVQR